MMPAPTHIFEWVIPDTDIIDEGNFSGKVRCPCGCEDLQILYPGQTHEYNGEQVPCTAEIDGKFFFIVKIKCTCCENEHTIFDADFHGWDGYVCNDPEQSKLPRPNLILYKCQACNSDSHKVRVNFETQGKQDFIDETCGDFPEDRWIDGFSWIDIYLTCSHCSLSKPQWVSYETM